MIFSVIIFGFFGGITGVTIGTEQINIIAHNTMRLPGHFHATVVGGTALSFMAVTYYVLPLIFRRRIAFWPLARIQPYLFAGGITTMAMSMTFMGVFGIPRRHWDTSFSGAPFSVDFHPVVNLLQAGLGIGAMVAATGALIFIAIAVVTVFFGKTFTEEDIANKVAGLPSGVLSLPNQVHEGEDMERVHTKGAPGTVILVFIFLACFVIYYFANWKMLSFLWKIG